MAPFRKFGLPSMLVGLIFAVATTVLGATAMNATPPCGGSSPYPAMVDQNGTADRREEADARGK